MNSYIKSYIAFIGFSAITAIIVRPIVRSLNVPLLNDIVG